MQYLVYSSGEILDRHSKAYVVNAKSKEMAKSIAKENFSEEFLVVGDNIYTKLYKRTSKAIIAYILMLIPILLSFISWKDGHNTISIMPSYVSCLYGVLFYAAFIVRFKGIQRAVESWIDITFCPLVVLLISSFVRVIMVSKKINIPILGEKIIDTNVVLPIILILSWAGLKLVSVICMAGLCIFAIFNIVALSNAMGAIWGPIYIICSFMGILFYCAVEPAILETLPHLRKIVGRGVEYFKNDFVEAKASAKAIEGKIRTRLGQEDAHISKE